MGSQCSILIQVQQLYHKEQDGGEQDGGDQDEGGPGDHATIGAS